MPTPKNLDARSIMILASLGSFALLIGAFGFQAAGYAPCGLCILQRWPHVFAVLIGAGVLITRQTRLLGVLGAGCALTATAFALYHVGVEMSWWEGPSQCSGTIRELATMSAQDLLAQIEAAPVVRCDEVAWRFLSLSMAGWNAVFSLGLTIVWIIGLRSSFSTRGQ